MAPQGISIFRFQHRTPGLDSPLRLNGTTAKKIPERTAKDSVKNSEHIDSVRDENDIKKDDRRRSSTSTPEISSIP